MLTLNREYKANYISTCLAFSLAKIKIANEAGQYDVNKVYENIACRLLNAMYDWNLGNVNDDIRRNFPGIDLMGNSSNNERIVVSVSSRRSKAKVRDGLSKVANLAPCHFYYMAIGEAPPEWGRDAFADAIPPGVIFDCTMDVLTFAKIYDCCCNRLDLAKLDSIYNICVEEFGPEASCLKMSCGMMAWELYNHFTNRYAGMHDWLTCEYCTAFLEQEDKWRLHPIKSSMMRENAHIGRVLDALNDFVLEGKALPFSDVYLKLQEIHSVEHEILALSERADYINAEEVEHPDYIATDEHKLFVANVRDSLERYGKLITECLMLVVDKTSNSSGAWHYFWVVNDA